MNNQARGGGNSDCRWAGILIVANQLSEKSVVKGRSEIRGNVSMDSNSRLFVQSGGIFQINTRPCTNPARNPPGNHGKHAIHKNYGMPQTA